MIIIIIITTLLVVHPRNGSLPTNSGALWVRKFGNLPIREILVIT